MGCKNCGNNLPLSLNGTKRTVYCSDECGDIFYKSIRGKKEMPFYEKRFRIFIRDDFKCTYCGKSSIEDGVKLEIDHIIPLKLTGNKMENEIWDNLTTACVYCNKGKKDVLLDEEIIKRLKNRVDIMSNKEIEIKNIFNNNNC